MTTQVVPHSLHSVLHLPLAMHQPALIDVVHQASHRSKGDPAQDSSSASSFITSTGVAVIPVHGMMTKHVALWSSRLSSDRLTEIVEELASRSDVTHLVLDVDSPGGQIAGTQQLAEAVFKARQSCIVTACVNELAASAALWVASAADHVVVPPTGLVGGIGVYTLHHDWSKAMDQAGIKETVIHAGKYKAIHERPLTKDLKAHEQGVIDGLYSEFVDSVARYRGVDAAHALNHWADGRMFLGTEAVAIGLADDFGTFTDVMHHIGC